MSPQPDTHEKSEPESTRSSSIGQRSTSGSIDPSAQEFLLRLHACTELRETSYVVASELRRLSGCDRVTVLVRRGSRLRVEAISNLDHFDARSGAVRAAEEFANSFDAESGAAWIDDHSDGDSDLSSQLRDFIEQSHSRVIGVLPLSVVLRQDEALSVDCVGIILCERFSAQSFDLEERRALELLIQHAAVAIGRTAALERIPLFHVLRALSGAGNATKRRERFKRLFLTLVAILLVGVAGFWPVPFTIHATGTLQPVHRREVFAPADGVIQELKRAKDGNVEAGDRLIEIRSDEIELEATRLAGELETSRRRLQTVQAARLEAVRPGTDRGEPPARLTAEEEQLKELIRGLESQLAFRNQQREQLSIRSPISGRILTWDVERLLRARPVRRGQRLLTIADTKGDWMLEMQIADADVGHVFAAARDSQLKISYRTATRPDVEQFGTLDKLSDWTEVSDAGRPAVKVTATIPQPDPRDARPGAVTSASIHLGTRSRFYVWFRQVAEYLQMHFW